MYGGVVYCVRITTRMYVSKSPVSEHADSPNTFQLVHRTADRCILGQTKPRHISGARHKHRRSIDDLAFGQLNDDQQNGDDVQHVDDAKTAGTVSSVCLHYILLYMH